MMTAMKVVGKVFAGAMFFGVMGPVLLVEKLYSAGDAFVHLALLPAIEEAKKEMRNGIDK